MACGVWHLCRTAIIGDPPHETQRDIARKQPEVLKELRLSVRFAQVLKQGLPAGNRDTDQDFLFK